MRMAIINDDLVQNGGQERLLSALSDLYPEADIFTSLASEYWIDYYRNKGRKIHTTFMQGIPFSDRLTRYYAPFLLHNLAYESISTGDYDLVLSQSSRFAHHITAKAKTKHICYMNSPARMFWEPGAYFKNETFGVLSPFKKLGNRFLKLPLSYLRQVDYVAAQRVDEFIANSRATADRIKKYYGRGSFVIYPFADTEIFKNQKSADSGYFCMVCRLVSWKRVDVAVKACAASGMGLKIIGSGPDIDRLKSLAGPKIDFLGHIGDAEKAGVLANSTALIQTQAEDFGIVPLEAMACGKPVIAFGFGGVLETVIPGVTGDFYYEQNPEILAGLLRNFNPSVYDPEKCKARAEDFSRDMFVKKVKEYVCRSYQGQNDIV